MQISVEKEWFSLMKNYCAQEQQCESIFYELRKQYTDRNRHYHNLSHITAMLQSANAHSQEIEDMDIMRLAIWFHDVVYDVFRKDNEEKSVLFMQNTLQKCDFYEAQLRKIGDYILATKGHHSNYENNDLAIFLDLDLEILGRSPEEYAVYAKNIRNEYNLVPLFVYNKARKTVLENFLKREVIFASVSFRSKYEQQARINLKNEIKFL